MHYVVLMILFQAVKLNEAKSVFYLLLVVRDGLSNKTKPMAYFWELNITRQSSYNYNNNTASRDYSQYYTPLFVDDVVSVM